MLYNQGICGHAGM